MATTFARHWAEISLTVYTEGFNGEDNAQVRFVDLDQAAPWLTPWKGARTPQQRGMMLEGYRYRWDAAKFVHKVAAIGAAAASAEDGVLIWMDADTVTHAPVTAQWLDSLFPSTADIAWLDRTNKYPECGFLMFRLPAAARVIHRLVKTYRSGAVFHLAEWHDSFVIETVVKAAETNGAIRLVSLSGEGRRSSHPFVNSRLAECLDHLKGARKAAGRSHPWDLLERRQEDYWQ